MILKGTDASYSSDITYTDSGRISSETIAGRETKYSYDELERTTKKRIVIDEEESIYLDTTYAYRTSDRGSAFTTNQLEAERVAGVRYEYEYDRNGNIVSVNRVDSLHDGKVVYVYDSHDQLIREDNPFSGTSVSYVYDTNGNLKTRTVSEYKNGMTGDVISEDRYNYGSLISGDRLTKINDEAVTYDGIGNPLNMDGWTLTWNGRRLTSMTKDDDVISFGYDSQGRRISRTVNGEKTRYFYVGDTVTGEDSASGGRIAYIYDSAGRISALTRTYNGETDTYHLMTNSRGDVEAVYTDEGEMMVRYIYDAYGNEISREYGSDSSLHEMADINPFRYRGYMYDEDTGFYYVSSRYYDSEIGRFINADDIDYLGADGSPLSYNLFAYCMNNPVNRFDVNGNWSLPNWAKIAIGAAAIAVGVIATAATGGAAAPVLVASLKIAATSAAIGTVCGAGISTVNHRVSTGSWEGAGKTAVTGAIDGACDGFMWGGITAGASFTTVAARSIKIKEIGKLKPSNKPGDGYTGVKYQTLKSNGKYTTRSIELHSPHKSGPHNVWHWQQNTWNPYNNSITGSAKHWTIWGKSL